ncbi:RNA-binding protein MEX3B-like [Eucyclogobius newberryi]|uniref:RNA-binding protein MEX3B-like n=1 Tax=Eucyclogobius newberryi TaxID=166745 RepID=UPI003B5AFD6A
MPSSTSLLEADEAESEVPPPLVHAFAGMGLEESSRRTPEQADESLAYHHHDDHQHHQHHLHRSSHHHFPALGTVLDLKPLHRSLSEEDASDAAAEDEDAAGGGGGSSLLAQAQRHHHHRHQQQQHHHRQHHGLEHASPVAETVLLYAGDERDDGGMSGAVALFADPCYEADAALLSRRKSVNTTECVAVPSSEHVAEIVGRQGCKIKALRAKTNTYIKTPVRGEHPVFVVTGRKEDVLMAKREILSAAEHFSLIRASRNKAGPLTAATGPGTPSLPGQTTIQVRVPYRVVGLVVGPKGATIKRIQQQTHTYIVTPSRDKEPVFEVTGMPENVDRAREEIEAHIAMRTGTSGPVEAPGADNNDFQFNGTDVSFEGSLLPLGPGDAGWLQAGAAPPNAGSVLALRIDNAQRVKSNNNGARVSSTYRNDSSSSLGSGSSSADSFYNGNRGVADLSPTCLFNANNNNSNGGVSGFWEGALPAGAEELVSVGSGSSSGFDPLTISTAPAPFSPAQGQIWSPFVDPPTFQSMDTRQSQTSQPGTPRLSPTFSGPDALEHPQAQRVQRRHFSGALDAQRFPSCSSAFSSSSDSTASSSSPPDSLPCRPAPASGQGGGAELCVHCLESQVMAALMPCGHSLFCLDCAARICRSAEPVCPVCLFPAMQAILVRNM